MRKDYQHSRGSFYADDGLLEHTDPNKLQKDLNEIILLFSRIGLQANDKKTKFMVVRGQPAPTALSKIVYDNIAKRKGRKGKSTTYYNQRRRKKTQCEICDKVLQVVSLKRHMFQQHGINLHEYKCREAPTNTGLFMVSNFNNHHDNPCPVPNCSGGGTTTWSMYRHFAQRHPEADIIIQADGELPKCDKCMMRCKNLKSHQLTKTCQNLSRRRNNERLQDAQAEGNNVKFYVGGNEIDRVHNFMYLGRLLSDDDDDSPAIDSNLRKARARWGKLVNILKREGANATIMSKFYMTIIQAVLLYGSDSWIIKDRDLNKLRSFHNRAIRYMTGSHIRKTGDGWEYPKHEELLKKCRLFPIDVYLERRRGTLREYLMKYRNNLLQKAIETKKNCRNVHKILWWDQPWISKRDMQHLTNLWYPG